MADGDTALYDVVVTASQHFTPAAEHKVLVLLSDGKDDGSTATLDEAVAAVQGEHVEAISLTTTGDRPRQPQALGTVTSADDAAGVSAAFARVAGLLADSGRAGHGAAARPTPATTVAPADHAPRRPRRPRPSRRPPRVVLASAGSVAADASAEASDSSVSLWLGAGGIFVGLFLLGLLLFPRQRVSKARLGIDKPRSVSDMGKRTDVGRRGGPRAARQASRSRPPPCRSPTSP